MHEDYLDSCSTLQLLLLGTVCVSLSPRHGCLFLKDDWHVGCYSLSLHDMIGISSLKGSKFTSTKKRTNLQNHKKDLTKSEKRPKKKKLFKFISFYLAMVYNSPYGTCWHRIDENMEETVSNVEGAQGQLVRYLNSISSNRWLMMKIFLVLIVFLMFFVFFVA